MNTIKKLINLFLIFLISIRLARSFELSNLIDFENIKNLSNLNTINLPNLNTINQFIKNNLIDLNTFNQLNNYINKINDYLLTYQFFNQDKLIKQPLNVCLLNVTQPVCWHKDDTFNIIDDKNDNLFQWFTNLNSLDNFNNLSNLTFNSLSTISLNLNKFTFNNLYISKTFFITYFDHFNNDELKSLLVCFNLFMPFVCSAFLFLLCIQNQHRRKIVELNQLFRKIECVSSLKDDMKQLAIVIDELKLDAKQNLELKNKLQFMLANEFKLKQLNHQLKTDLNGNLISIGKGGDHENLSSNFNEQIDRINQQLKLNQLEQSKLKYMVCKTIESFDRILNKMHKQFQST